MQITPRDLHQVEQFAAIGLTQREIATMLEVSHSTFELWLQKPEVRAAFEKGRANGIAVAGKKLWDKIQDGDLGAIIWFEKTRGKRTDRIQVVSEDDAASLQRQLHGLSNDQLRLLADGHSPEEVLGS